MKKIQLSPNVMLFVGVVLSIVAMMYFNREEHPATTSTTAVQADGVLDAERVAAKERRKRLRRLMPAMVF